MQMIIKVKQCRFHSSANHLPHFLKKYAYVCDLRKYYTWKHSQLSAIHYSHHGWYGHLLKEIRRIFSELNRMKCGKIIPNQWTQNILTDAHSFAVVLKCTQINVKWEFSFHFTSRLIYMLWSVPHLLWWPFFAYVIIFLSLFFVWMECLTAQDLRIRFALLLLFFALHLSLSETNETSIVIINKLSECANNPAVPTNKPTKFVDCSSQLNGIAFTLRNFPCAASTIIDQPIRTAWTQADNGMPSFLCKRIFHCTYRWYLNVFPIDEGDFRGVVYAVFHIK